ncbi:MAG: hypothetical protein COZ74_11090 [Flavobacteriaceae bacterium CG_4_8_14_3_um_filter_31_8]|nr:MAG: hypothetical protein COZ74_11090 [Flavobacteriaceae bacterium CG_4_8_14_3_um_filter_31_8]PJC11197.1 MAG: hypothetical protein CO067_00155 [Flavobacteriaceae bacterium CG_4_9_14_0_8_um_filter_31_91]
MSLILYYKIKDLFVFMSFKNNNNQYNLRKRLQKFIYNKTKKTFCVHYKGLYFMRLSETYLIF